MQVLEQVPKAKGVLVTAGGNGSAYAFRDPSGGKPLTNRVRAEILPGLYHSYCARQGGRVG